MNLQQVKQKIADLFADKKAPLADRTQQLLELNAMRELLEHDQKEEARQAAIDELINQAQTKFDAADAKAKQTKATAKKAAMLTDKLNSHAKAMAETLDELDALGEMGRFAEVNLGLAMRHFSNSQRVRTMVRLNDHTFAHREPEPFKARTEGEIAKAERARDIALSELEEMKQNAATIVDNRRAQQAEQVPVSKVEVQTPQDTGLTHSWSKEESGEKTPITPIHQEVDLR